MIFMILFQSDNNNYSNYVKWHEKENHKNLVFIITDIM